MDTQSRTALLIAFGLVGAFVLGAIAATTGFATLGLAATMAGGPESAHGGPRAEMSRAGECDPHGWMSGDSRERDCGENPCGEERRPRDLRGGETRDPRGSEMGGCPLSEDAREGMRCPEWGTF
jgi:hypothetical protein